ncbi:unnamed protein product [Cylindrotheca closterium]|uniref:PPM-type phosphatase domain-containing protein n=1 Tax=Cylindrotheca closterium TaxID=2856 RepID=A0AAD2FTS7_9STRA|nr:unnamed protein product [Cylindrotheca closterium]
MYKTTKGGAIEDHTPPKLDSDGHLAPEEVQKRITASESVSTTTVGDDEKTDIEYATVTQRGYYPDIPGKQNQDAHSITLTFGGEETDVMFTVCDGHGASGHDCARFVNKDLPRSIAKFVRQTRSQHYVSKLKAEGKSTKGAFKPELWPLLEVEEYEECCRKGFAETNKALDDDKTINDKLSGTTAITISFHKGRMTVCNVGDSRALLGHFNEDGILPIPLSKDQTPYRKDERDRVQALGAEIKSIDQLKGREEMHDDWGDMVHGELVNPTRDPPRVWVKGSDFPGTAFTRSIGDTVAESIGVVAEPEIITRRLTENDKFLVIASDGLFEFLTNKEVCSIVEENDNAADACQKLREAAYTQWIENEDRVDDITIVVCFLNNTTAPDLNAAGTTEDLVSVVGSFYGTPGERELSAKSEDEEENEKNNVLPCGLDLCLGSGGGD